MHYGTSNHPAPASISNNHEVKSSTVSINQKSFHAQVAINDNLYEIPIKYKNTTKAKLTDYVVKIPSDVSKINEKVGSTESVNFALNALGKNLVATPSTSTRSQKVSNSNDNGNKNKENILLPVEQLDEPSTIAVQIKNAQNIRRHAKLPHGVVPFQSNLDAIQVDADNQKVDGVENNRYSNVINEAVEETNDVDMSKELQNGNADSDTGAREENDSNGFVMDEHNSHLQKPLKHKTNENAFDAKKSIKFHENNAENSINIPNDEDLQVIHQLDDENRIPLNGDKLKNEVNEDQGKAYPDEVNFQVEDEDGKHLSLIVDMNFISLILSHYHLNSSR